MEGQMSGREYLNEIIPGHNKLEIEINTLEKNLKSFLGDITIKNIAKIHRDKSYENYNLFKDTTYTDDDSLKVSLDSFYCAKMKEASEIFIEICHNFTEYINKKWNVMLKIKIMKQLEQYNEICTYLEEYKLKDHLVEFFNIRYSGIDVTRIQPGSIIELYKKDIHSLKDIGLTEVFEENKEAIEDIIKTKEMECCEYWTRVYKFKLSFLNNAMESIREQKRD